MPKKQTTTNEIYPFSLVLEPKGYSSKREITNCPQEFLVKGSKNIIINDSDKWSTRLGYVLDGQAKTINKGTDSSYDFVSKQGIKVLKSNQGINSFKGTLQVRTEYTNGSPLYVNLLENLTYTNFNYTSWWYDTEVTRCLIFVDGTTSIRMWGGGLAYIKSNTTDTITKTGALMTASTLSFVSSTKKIIDSANGFITAGFVVGDKILVTGSTSNNKDYVIESVTAGEIVVTSASILIDELAGATVTIKKEGTKTWAEEGFFISLASRKVTINGIEYTYTGGETTLTLTGLSAVPVLTLGTPVLQSVVTINSLTGVSPAITPNIVWTKDNSILYGSTQSSVIWGSKITDYKDCSFTTPLRKPGEGFKITPDNNAVGFTQDENSIYIFAGTDDRYKVKFIMSSDGTTESITVDKKIAAGQAAISQSGIIPVKNGVMYFTNEKTLTWLTSIENVFTPQALPTSDPIKDDFDAYDLTGVSGIFYGNAVWIAIPRENLVYIYDFDKALWQAPQTIPVSRFSIIDNVLYGHSNSSNESYKLNTGTDDNGVIIEFVAAFAYRNFGDRATLKQFDEYYTEVYLTKSTILKTTHYFEYSGSDGIIPTELDGGISTYMFATSKDVSLGKDNLGKNPLGGSSTFISNLNKYRCFDDIKAQDFFEHQVVYSSDSENAQFELIAHGPNVRGSTNLPKYLHK